MITVKSWQELLELGERELYEEIDVSKVQIDDDLSLKIRISGKSWSEYVDYRGARYILELQKTTNTIYKELSGDDVSLRDLSEKVTVKVKVEKGSSWIEINIGEAMTTMLNALSGDQMSLIAIVAIMSATGAYSLKKFWDYKREKELKVEDAKTQRVQAEKNAEVMQTVVAGFERAFEFAERIDAEKPARTLVSKLEPGDAIELPAHGTLSEKQAKSLYPRKPRLSYEKGYFDDDYEISQIDFSKTPPIFTLNKDSLEFRALAELDNNSIDRLSLSLNEALKKGETLDVPLNVFIVYNRRGIKNASITGLDKKRETSVSIQTLIEFLD